MPDWSLGASGLGLSSKGPQSGMFCRFPLPGHPRRLEQCVEATAGVLFDCAVCTQLLLIPTMPFQKKKGRNPKGASGLHQKLFFLNSHGWGMESEIAVIVVPPFAGPIFFAHLQGQ